MEKLQKIILFSEISLCLIKVILIGSQVTVFQNFDLGNIAAMLFLVSWCFFANSMEHILKNKTTHTKNMAFRNILRKKLSYLTGAGTPKINTGS